MFTCSCSHSIFFVDHSAPPVTYTLSLHDALPILVPTRIGEVGRPPVRSEQHALRHAIAPHLQRPPEDGDSQSSAERSEEHTSELQSHSDLVCRLLLEKKNKNRDKQHHLLTHQ